VKYFFDERLTVAMDWFANKQLLFLLLELFCFAQCKTLSIFMKVEYLLFMRNEIGCVDIVFELSKV